MKETLSIIWSIACLFGGMMVLEWLLEIYPREIYIFITLYFMLWFVALYLGHAIIGTIIRWVKWTLN